ncbi:hypothetical protein CDSM653_02400 [Caldanaerobacter subterraneus subsp. pacificus DSM 12653]|uniref:Uncharacterized protein n=1 Tax=Caldanaerobacter subterraneus subsp. pacificus DSM 12653 TaxID=391606 RepID=A0A0F5PJ00_9THEO|nr:hypothetical protein CDSM653_02400 [Caldanaerobacter subterraneus subsp. pacificus DSM 12653]
MMFLAYLRGIETRKKYFKVKIINGVFSLPKRD